MKQQQSNLVIKTLKIGFGGVLFNQVNKIKVNQSKHPQRNPNQTPTLVFCLKTSYFFLNGCFVGECLIWINRVFHSILDRSSGLAVLSFRTCCSQELEGELTKDIPVKLQAVVVSISLRVPRYFHSFSFPS